MLAAALSAIPVFEPVIVWLMAQIRPDAIVRCETVNQFLSVCTYIPAP